jgi:hypothetical protein
MTNLVNPLVKPVTNDCENAPDRKVPDLTQGFGVANPGVQFDDSQLKCLVEFLADVRDRLIHRPDQASSRRS